MPRTRGSAKICLPVLPLVEFMVRNCHCFALRRARAVLEAPTFEEDLSGPADPPASAALVDRSGPAAGGRSLLPSSVCESREPSMFKEEIAGAEPSGHFGKHWMGTQAVATAVTYEPEPSMFKEELTGSMPGGHFEGH